MDNYFFIFTFLGFVSSICVISCKNAVYSVFFLIVTFCLSACVLFLITIDFLSLILIIVYVGAIAVLFLFIVMMLNIRLAQVNESIVRFLPIMVFLAIVLLTEVYYVISINSILLLDYSVEYERLFGNNASITLFSRAVYTHFGYSFIVAGFILLMAMLGTISLTLRHSLHVKRQSVYQQVGRNVANSIFFFNYHNKNNTI